MAEYLKTQNGSFLPIGGLNVYVEQMTQAEYDALPQATQDDNHFRVVVNPNGDEPGLQASEIASDNGNVQDDLNALDHINGIGASASIASGTPYTCPSDGLLSIYIYNGKSMDVKANNVRVFDVKNVAGTGQTYGVTVRKGMIISCTFASTDGSLTFFPFI